jgi:predicted metal-binding membrane protein
VAILAGMIGVTLLAWTYLLTSAATMSGMEGMTMPEMADMPEMIQLRAWSPTDFLLMFAMWSVMLVGMMVPTAIPMTLIYAAVARKAARQSTPMAPTAIFVLGYVSMWTLFSAGATVLQFLLERAALLSPMMVSKSPLLGAGILIAAGAYQWTPLKNVCLRHCRAPAQFFSEHWRGGALGAYRMGFDHGAWCLGCCAILMLLLFVGGVMNFLWIALISLFVLVEKVIPFGPNAGRVAGAAMIVAGIVILVRLQG